MAVLADIHVGEIPDETLVRAAQAGDMHALELLYNRYARMVHGVLLAKLPISEVEDLVQDVFLNAMRNIKRLREPATFGAWLISIARNRAADFHRNATPCQPLDSESHSPPDSCSDRASALAILDIIRSLPDAYRETLILRLVEGFTGPEIAARTGLTHGSVRVNLSRGMQLLRDALQSKVQS